MKPQEPVLFQVHSMKPQPGDDERQLSPLSLDVCAAGFEILCMGSTKGLVHDFSTPGLLCPKALSLYPLLWLKIKSPAKRTHRILAPRSWIPVFTSGPQMLANIRKRRIATPRIAAMYASRPNPPGTCGRNVFDATVDNGETETGRNRGRLTEALLVG